MRNRAPEADRRSDATAGFTLLEMLVALALLAMFASALPQAYGLLRKTWGTSAALSRDNPEQSARSFLLARLGEAAPVYERRSEGDEIAFSGTADSVNFVAPLAHAPAGGGLYRFRLFVGPDANGRSALQVALELQNTPLQREAFQSNTAAPDVRRLAPASALRVRYFGRPSAREKALWLDSWSRVDTLPDLVEITLVRENGTQVPPTTIELRMRSGQ